MRKCNSCFFRTLEPDAVVRHLRRCPHPRCQMGATGRHYLVMLHRLSPPEHAALEGLAVPGAALSPAFAPSEQEYAAELPFGVAAATVTAWCAPGAAIEVAAAEGRVRLRSGEQSPAIAVPTGGATYAALPPLPRLPSPPPSLPLTHSP